MEKLKILDPSIDLDFLIPVAIERNEISDLETILDNFVWEDLTEKEVVEIFQMLLNTTYEHFLKTGNKQMGEFTIRYWNDKIRHPLSQKESRIDSQSGAKIQIQDEIDNELDLDAYPYMYSLNVISVDLLNFCKEFYPEITELTLYSLYNRCTMDDYLKTFALSRILQVFGIRDTKQGYDDYKRFVEEESKPNGPTPVVTEFFEENILKNHPFVKTADIPPYVGNFLTDEQGDEVRDVSFSQIEASLSSIEQSMPQITLEDIPDLMQTYLPDSVQFNIGGLSTEDQKKKLLSLIKKEISNKKNKKELESQIIAPLEELNKQTLLQQDEQLFQIFGPSFPEKGMDFAPDNVRIELKKGNPCFRFGGCRLQLCTHHQVYDDYDDDYDPSNYDLKNSFYDVKWYTGQCEQCNLKIKDQQFAVRIPMPMGGWKGCFCSWKCVRLALASESQIYHDSYGKSDDQILQEVDTMLYKTLAKKEKEGDQKEKEDIEIATMNSLEYEEEKYKSREPLVDYSTKLEAHPNEKQTEMTPAEMELRKNLKEEKTKEKKKEEQPAVEIDIDSVRKMLEDPYNDVNIVQLILCKEFENQMIEKGIQNLTH